MIRRWLALVLLLPFLLAARSEPGLPEWLSAVRAGLQNTVRLARGGDVVAARAEVTRVYLDYYEVIEGWYGPGGAHASPKYEKQIAATEASFHALLRAGTAAELETGAQQLQRTLDRIGAVIEKSGAPLYPAREQVAARGGAGVQTLTTPELALWNGELQSAQKDLSAGNYASALKRVERIYLEGFEPLEARLPADVVNRLERTIHLQLRPALKAQSSDAQASFDLLASELYEADRFLLRGGSFWFGALNSLVIIIREGLEAVLLIGALLAYLTATRAAAADRRRIWLGAAAGIVASLLTWVVARTLLPMSGASRELMEGVTALVAVGVLLYVSHWLFQKTYIHDWKEYLREHLGEALGRGSAFAMMGLAFAAVYREGFETVLFYQALILDVGGRSVLTGFLPGVLIISAVGYAIIRAGVKLPLKRVFAITNAILLYLAFVFLGKGVFNLQESGAFSAHPIGWLPSHPALQQIFGFYPLVETIAAQAVLALLLAGAWVFYKGKAARKATGKSERSPALAA